LLKKTLLPPHRLFFFPYLLHSSNAASQHHQ
jgi:hypothetical protein